MDKFTDQSKQTQALVELISERAKLLENTAKELAEIDQKIAGAALQAGLSFNGTGASHVLEDKATAKATVVKRGPGRPKKIDGVKRGPGRPKKSTDDNQPPLGEVITALVQRNKNGLELHELVTKALQAGYQSSSGNFKNMVEQAVGKLLRKNVLVKDQDTMRYLYAEVA